MLLPFLRRAPDQFLLTYRQISLTSVCVKNLERIGTYQLYQYLEDIVMISDSHLMLFTRILWFANFKLLEFLALYLVCCKPLFKTGS